MTRIRLEENGFCLKRGEAVCCVSKFVVYWLQKQPHGIGRILIG